MATHQKIQWRFTKALLRADRIFATTRVRLPVPDLDPVEQRIVSDLAAYARKLNADVTTSPV
jgi:hypothetical protein